MLYICNVMKAEIELRDNSLVVCRYENNNTLIENSKLFSKFDKAIDDTSLWHYGIKNGYRGGHYGDKELVIMFTRKKNNKVLTEIDALQIYIYLNEL